MGRVHVEVGEQGARILVGAGAKEDQVVRRKFGCARGLEPQLAPRAIDRHLEVLEQIDARDADHAVGVHLDDGLGAE
ncbi:MAG: hypothetical protein L3J02_06330, partial [Henriciella sp.]|nr:hypothetical protein [Henriciella sp.]